jgi:uncharacterized protein
MKRTISVVGLGRVSVAPDVADVRLGVSVTRPTVSEARKVAADTAGRILESLRSLGIARSDVGTVSLAVQPDYEYREGEQRLRGQAVIHEYRVTVRDLDRLGAVIDDALAAGATTLGGVEFRAADPEAALTAARIAAMHDARDRATTLATEAGLTLGEVLRISEQPMTGDPRPFAGRMALKAAAVTPTPVEAGEQEIAVGLAVVFALA